ncbi:MAG TPA: hypothetical protein VFZ61_01920 [Polyangiales bacterium]
MRGLSPLLCLSLLAASLAPARASACSSPTPAPFEIDGSIDDDTPPPAPELGVERVKRGKAPDREGCSYEASSCDSTAYVLIDVLDGQDDLGFVLELSGDVPASLRQRVPTGPVMPMLEPGKLRVTWDDGEGEEDLDFEITVWSVDRAGNMSDEPTRIRVRSDGSSGCSTRGGSGSSAWLALLGGLWLARRPPRRRRSP